MSLVVGTNTTSLAVQRARGASDAALQQAIERTSRDLRPSASVPESEGADFSPAVYAARPENRFQAIINELALGGDLTSAGSRVLDADFAQEGSGLTKNQILVQAGVAMLAQANSQPQSVLAALGY